MSARRTRVAHLLFAVAVLCSGLAVILPAGPTEAVAAAGSSAVTKSVTATRVFLDENGNATASDPNQVQLTVSQTQNLRGRQEVHVSWTGAHPTGGTVADPNSADGRNQEYPFVLLQCRGVDTTGKLPQGQDRLTPETCWTQTSVERYVSAASQTPSWRFDADASAEEREPVVGQPESLPVECVGVSEPLTAHWLPFRAEGGTVYYGGPDPGVGCTPTAPESDDAEAGGLPSNTTYGITGVDGAGESDFAVWTAAENASLGCSATVSCSLVAVPIVGVSCDAWGTRLPSVQTTKNGDPLTDTQKATADATCRKTGAYLPGEAKSSQTSDQAVRGNLWWSPSNWKNRINVPLGFAATGEVCDAVSKDTPVKIMGSTALNELTASWRPTFCTDKDLFTFTHVQQADSVARSLVDTGQIDAAFSSAPREGGYLRPVVQAPIAVGGFAIAFTIDDVERRRRETLRLDARLVAKLMTASYSAMPVIQDNDPNVSAATNPLNITLDPEFQALNPGLPVSSNLEAAATLQSFSANSDLIWALTSWINGDPEARAWLDGAPDPWGMRINAAYQGIELPVDNWPLLDDVLAPDWYRNQNACYDRSPTPMMQLIASPVSNLSTVLLNMQFATSTVSTVCKYDGYDPTTLPLRQQGRQTVGYRFVLGLVSLSAARRYNLRTAALQTTSTDGKRRAFDPNGRTFVAPDDAGLKAATALLEPDAAAGTWELDDELLSTDAGAAAYPGVLPIYAVVPTQGLEEKTATDLAKLLCYASDDGQVQGAANGQLPAGYLPVTEANGLGAQHDYVLNAVAAVRAQAGDVPALDAEPPDQDEVCDFSPATPTADPTPTRSPHPTSAPSVDAPVAPIPDVTVPTASGGKSGGPSESAAPVTEAQTRLTAGQASSFGRLGVPGLLVLAVLCALAGTLVRWFDPITAAVAVAVRRRR